MRLLCDALSVNNSMKTLSLKKYSHRNITSVGWNELSKVLRDPNCKLVNLDLFGAVINDDAMNTMGNALSGSPVKALDLSNNKSISSAGWKALFNQLTQTSIESLDLKQTKISDSGLAALAGIGTLKSLNLYDSDLITPTGWRSFFNLLETRGIQLRELDISWNKVGDEGISGLGRLLRITTALKSFRANGMRGLSRTTHVTSQSWISFFTTLQDSNLDLVELDIHYNQIDGEGLQLLIRLASSMTSLKVLGLRQNQLVTPTGWQALSGFLQSPNLALRKLDLDSNNINDDTLVALTSALENNKTLKRLELYSPFGLGGNESVSITSRGWEAVSTLLCNNSSIMNTYNSNHTLHKLIEDDDYEYLNLDLPHDIFQDIVSSLKLNNNKDKVEVARQKILQTHFSSEDGETSKLEELLDMELEAMPTVIAWIGRTYLLAGTCALSGLSTMFNLLRSLPDLFDSNAQKKTGGAKRKRDL